LTRVLYSEFKIILTNVVFLIFTGLVLYFLSDVILILHPPLAEPPGNTSSASVKGLFYAGSYSSSHFWVIRIMKIFLTFVLAFTGFMIGRNWSNTSKK
jgi:hypothetical protein